MFQHLQQRVMSEESSGNRVLRDEGNSTSGRHNNKNKKKKSKSPKSYSSSRFEGQTEEIKSFVYDTGVNTKDEFSKSTREIGYYMAQNFNAIVAPPDPDDNATRVQFSRWKDANREYTEQVKLRKINIQRAFGVVIGQCSPNVTDLISADDTYGSIKSQLDVIALFELIRKVLYSGATTKQSIVTEIDALKAFMNFTQPPHMSVSKYYDQFNEHIDRVKHLGIELGETSRYVDSILAALAFDPVNPTDEEERRAHEIASEKYYATMMIQNANPTKFGSFNAELSNEFMKGRDNYPLTLAKARDYLVNYQQSPTPAVCQNADKGGVAHYGREQTADQGGRGQGRGGGRGRGSGRGRGGRGGGRQHRDQDQDDDSQQDKTHAIDEADDRAQQHEVASNNNSDASTPYSFAYAVVLFSNASNTSIGMDSCSSVNIISNPEMLTDIHVLDKSKWIPIVTVGKEIVHLKQ